MLGAIHSPRTIPLLGLLLAACPSGPPPGALPETCEVGFVLDDEACVPRFDTCEDGERPVFGGGCAPGGVPDGSCADGFTWDSVGGCTPVLPETPCPASTFATPGDSTCRPVGDCGTGRWGNLPVDADTIYVDAGYTGTTSNGSEAQPFKAIGTALLTNPPAGTLIAVAAGTYPEALVIKRAVRLWGVCADQVHIQGGAGTRYQVDVVGAAVDLQGFSITSPGAGLSLYQVPSGRVAEVRVHDTGQEGLDLQHSGTTSPVEFTDVLVEGAHEHGALLLAAAANFTRSVLRGARPGGSYDGVGLFASDASDGTRSVVTLDHVRLTDNSRVGLAVFESDAQVLGTVIEDTRPDAVGRTGLGIDTSERAGGTGSTLLLDQSVVRRVRSVAVYIQGQLTMRRSVIEQVLQREQDALVGWGLLLDPLDDGTPSVGTIENSIVRDTHELAVSVLSSRLEATGLRVERVELGLRDSPPPGTGISLEHKSDFPGAPEAIIRESLVQDVADRGISVNGGHLVIEDTVIRRVVGSVGGVAGVGIAAQHDARYDEIDVTLDVSRTLVEDVRLAGIIAEGSTATVSDTVVRRVDPERSSSAYGAGLYAMPSQQDEHRASMHVKRSLIASTFEVGVGVLGATAILEDTIVRGVAPSSGSVLGDGVTAITVPKVDGTFLEAEVTLSGGMIDDAERAGLSLFGAKATISGLVLRCNGLDLNTSDTLPGRNGATATLPTTLEDGGENACGCEKLSTRCRAESEHLEPTTSPIVTAGGTGGL